MSNLRRAATAGTSEVLADNCTDVTYANGWFHFSLTMEYPIGGNGKTATRDVPVAMTPRGFWALQIKVLNAPKGRGRLNG